MLPLLSLRRHCLCTVLPLILWPLWTLPEIRNLARSLGKTLSELDLEIAMQEIDGDGSGEVRSSSSSRSSSRRSRRKQEQEQQEQVVVVVAAVDYPPT